MTTMHVHVVLDRSGSMNDCWTDTIGGLNALLTKMRAEHPDAGITIAAFDSEEPYLVVRDGAAKSIEPIQPSEIGPRGLTPLYDAVGHMLAPLKAVAKPDDRRHIVILTDGMENHSREFNVEQVRALIKFAQDQKWIVQFLGADMDAWGAASQLGVIRQFSQSYSKAATRGMTQSLAASSDRYFSAETKAAGIVSASFTAEEQKAMGAAEWKRPGPIKRQ